MLKILKSKKFWLGFFILLICFLGVLVFRNARNRNSEYQNEVIKITEPLVSKLGLKYVCEYEKSGQEFTGGGSYMISYLAGSSDVLQNEIIAAYQSNGLKLDIDKEYAQQLEKNSEPLHNLTPHVYNYSPTTTFLMARDRGNLTHRVSLVKQSSAKVKCNSSEVGKSKIENVDLSNQTLVIFSYN